MKKAIMATVGALGTFAIGMGVGASRSEKTLGKEIVEHQSLSEKHLDMFLLMNQWLKLKQEGKRIDKALEERGYSKIAIYGLSYIGERLYDELNGSCIEVKYGIDKRADFFYSDLQHFTMDDELPAVDAIIVTPIYYFEEIKQSLAEKTDCPIVSIEDIIFEI